jgi:hypothetical protein
VLPQKRLSQAKVYLRQPLKQKVFVVGKKPNLPVKSFRSDSTNDQGDSCGTTMVETTRNEN